MKWKTTGKFIGTAITVFVSLLYLTSCLTPYIPPEKFPLLTVLSIGFIITFFIYCITALIWLLLSRRTGIILLLLLLAGYKNIFSTFGINFFDSNTSSKTIQSIRILSWNVNEFGGNLLISDTPGSKRRNMFAFIKQAKPDILCLQDITENYGSPEYLTNLKTIMEKNDFTGYHYAGYQRTRAGNFSQQYGVAVFSKLPILHSGSIAFNKVAQIEENSEYIDVLYKQRKLRIINAHLTSMSLWPAEKAGADYLDGDSTQTRLRDIFSKLLSFGKVHAKEARVLRSVIDTISTPVIFCGDLNSVPSSYVYQHIKGNLKDVFLEKGYFLGGTYNRLFPKVRIDVIFHSKEMQLVNYYRPLLNYSDHCPIIADLKWKE